MNSEGAGSARLQFFKPAYDGYGEQFTSGEVERGSE